MILREVESAPQPAFAGHARPSQLRHAIIVGYKNPHRIFNLGPHLRRTGFRTQQADPQLILLHRIARFLHGLPQIQGIGGSGHQTGNAKIPEHHQLLGRIARGGRNHRSPQLFQAVVQAQGAGEQAVAKGDLDDIPFGGASAHRHPGYLVRPVFNVLAGIHPNSRLSSGAGGSVDPHDLLHGLGQHLERVIIPDVILRGTRDILNVA